MIKINDKEVYNLALGLENPRLAGEERRMVDELPLLQAKQNRRRRMLTGGALTFMEAKILVREQLTHKLWKITFYEVVQMPQLRFFDTEATALEYYDSVTTAGRNPRGAKIMAKRMELMAPAETLFQDRETIREWKAPSYTRDLIDRKYP